MISDLAVQLRSRLPFFIPPPDSRSEAEIEADIADEIAFHLKESEREFVDAGESDETARSLAKERFGNVDQYKREMKSIALRERIMLQRINFVLMIIVLLVVGAVGVQVFMTQRYNTLALQSITSEIAEMKVTAQAEARMGRVIVEGEIENPGWHEFSLARNETLADLLRRLNVNPCYFVSSEDDPGQSRARSVAAILQAPFSQYLRDGERFKILRSYAHLDPNADPADNLRGRFDEVGGTRYTVDGNWIVPASLEILPADHAENPYDQPMGRLRAYSLKREILLVFDTKSSELKMMDADTDAGGSAAESTASTGLWSIGEDGYLHLDLGSFEQVAPQSLIFGTIRLFDDNSQG